jgi:hypothetical protein
VQPNAVDPHVIGTPTIVDPIITAPNYTFNTTVVSNNQPLNVVPFSTQPIVTNLTNTLNHHKNLIHRLKIFKRN